MSKFKQGDLVTIGDDKSKVYTIEELDMEGDPVVWIDGKQRVFLQYTGSHWMNELPPIQHFDPSGHMPSTPLDFAQKQVSGLSYEEYSGNKAVEEEPNPATGGLRFDSNKLRLDLLPAEWELELARITTEGSKKYAPRNWEKGMKWTKMIGCFRRHFLKFMLGEKYDKETGCHHLGLAAWNLLALMSYDMRGLGENDIPPSVKIGPNFEREDNT